MSKHHANVPCLQTNHDTTSLNFYTFALQIEFGVSKKFQKHHLNFGYGGGGGEGLFYESNSNGEGLTFHLAVCGSLFIRIRRSQQSLVPFLSQKAARKELFIGKQQHIHRIEKRLHSKTSIG